MEMTTVDEYQQLTASFERALRAQRKSGRTVTGYMAAASYFHDYLQAQGMPLEVAHIKREHIEAWMVELLSRHKPSSVSTRYRALQQFFKWCLEEGEINSHPMQNMRAPRVP